MDTPELTPKQKCFVNEYIIDLNAKAAAERAGYSKRMSKAIGWELLQKPHIAAAIAEEISAREKRTRVSADRVLEQLARVAFFDIRKMFTPDGALKPLERVGDDEAAAIASFEVVETVTGAVIRKVRITDRIAALEKLGRHLGLFHDKMAVKGDAENPIAALIACVQGSTLPVCHKDREGE